MYDEAQTTWVLLLQCYTLIYFNVVNRWYCIMNHLSFSKYRIFLLLIAVLLIWQAVKFVPWQSSLKEKDIDHGPAPSGAITPVLVSVFYEALCPDSKNFIVKQLFPAVNKASRLFNISFIPYGKAKTEDIDGNISFTCQHGPTECLANKIHGCATSKIHDSELLVKYISCMISDNMIPELVGEKCAKELDIDWKPILQCTYSEEGRLILQEFGKETDALKPKMTFVPTILLDKMHKNQAAILKDFFKQVCMMFKKPPVECNT